MAGFVLFIIQLTAVIEHKQFTETELADFNASFEVQNQAISSKLELNDENKNIYCILKGTAKAIQESNEVIMNLKELDIFSANYLQIEQSKLFKDNHSKLYIYFECNSTILVYRRAKSNRSLSHKAKSLYTPNVLPSEKSISTTTKNLQLFKCRFFKSYSFFEDHIRSISSKLYSTKNGKGDLNSNNSTLNAERTSTMILDKIKTKSENYINKPQDQLPQFSAAIIKKIYNLKCDKESKTVLKDHCFFYILTKMLDAVAQFNKILNNYKLNTFLEYIDSNANNISEFKLKSIIHQEDVVAFRKFIIRKLILKKRIAIKYNTIKEKSKEIAQTSIKYKKDQLKVYNNLLCLKCKKRPKVILPPCGHILLCDKCVQKINICLKCGNAIGEYLKLFRS